jgi:hypothetical protein
LSCEGSSSGKLVGGEANRQKTGRLASEGLHEDLTTTEVELRVNGGLLLDVVVSKGTTILELLASGQWTLLTRKVHSTPITQQAEQSWLHTRREQNDVPVNFS